MNKKAQLFKSIAGLFLELSQSFDETPETQPKPQPAQPAPKPQSKPTQPAPPVPEPIQLAEPIKQEASLLELVTSDEWPQAVDLNSMVKTEEDKFERAEGIIDLMIEHHVENLKFLDFGCGEGHIAKTILSQTPKLSIGYDIVLPENKIIPWEEQQDSLLLTTDLKKVEAQGPFDVILVYDVLDHAANPIDALKTIKKLAHDKTKIFVRCHPWCSRHGGHLYQDINKAFAHMFLTDEQIKTLTGKEVPFCQKVLYPQKTYINWFSQVDFNVRHENTDKNIVEPFFQNPTISPLFEKIFNTNSFPKFQLEQSFLDFVLLLKK